MVGFIIFRNEFEYVSSVFSSKIIETFTFQFGLLSFLVTNCWKTFLLSDVLIIYLFLVF